MLSYHHLQVSIAHLEFALSEGYVTRFIFTGFDLSFVSRKFTHIPSDINKATGCNNAHVTHCQYETRIWNRGIIPRSKMFHSSQLPHDPRVSEIHRQGKRSRSRMNDTIQCTRGVSLQIERLWPLSFLCLGAGIPSILCGIDRYSYEENLKVVEQSFTIDSPVTHCNCTWSDNHTYLGHRKTHYNACTDVLFAN